MSSAEPIVSESGRVEMHRISRGTGTLGQRFFCRIRRGHWLGEAVPDWFPGGPGRICTRCGGVYQSDDRGGPDA